MSNSGVNTAFAKCFILFMAVVILLQGSVFLGLSIWGILRRQCSQKALELSSESFQFAVNLIYFSDKACGNPSVRLPGVIEPITLDGDFNKAESIATRTFIFSISYAVISSLWIIGSLSIITTLCGLITRTAYGVCYWPWFLIVISGSLLDAVATGFHIDDITNTTSVAKTFKYLGISSNSTTIDVLSNFDAYFIAPSIVMTCISSRLILIWLLNIFGSSFCLSLSKTLSKRNTRNPGGSCITNIQQELHQGISPAQVQQCQERPRGNERSKPTLASLTIQTFHEQVISSSLPDERSTNVNSPKASSNLTPPCTESKENNDDNIIKNHPDRVNYLSPQNLIQYQQQLSSISPLNNRYSSNNESFQYPMQNQRVSEELRAQLPWSYTSLPLPVPKKSQVQVYPEIPAPDYGN